MPPFSNLAHHILLGLVWSKRKLDRDLNVRAMCNMQYSEFGPHFLEEDATLQGEDLTPPVVNSVEEVSRAAAASAAACKDLLEAVRLKAYPDLDRFLEQLPSSSLLRHHGRLLLSSESELSLTILSCVCIVVDEELAVDAFPLPLSLAIVGGSVLVRLVMDDLSKC